MDAAASQTNGGELLSTTPTIPNTATTASGPDIAAHNGGASVDYVSEQPTGNA